MTHTHMDESDATPELPDPEPDGFVETKVSLECPVAWNETPESQIQESEARMSRGVE